MRAPPGGERGSGKERERELRLDTRHPVRALRGGVQRRRSRRPRTADPEWMLTIGHNPAPHT
jgi:hypothetical protein